MMRAAIYQRGDGGVVPPDDERAGLDGAAQARGWTIVAVYADAYEQAGERRARRPQLERMLRDAAHGRFDVAIAWTADRLGRSLTDLIGTMQKLGEANVGLLICEQNLDTTTPSGQAIMGMLGVFSDFEQSIIRGRVKRGMENARARGKNLGREPIPQAKEALIREHLAQGLSILKVAALVGAGNGTVHRIKRAMAAEAVGEKVG